MSKYRCVSFPCKTARTGRAAVEKPVRDETSTGDDTAQPGRKANTETLTTALIINLHLGTGRSTKPIKKENERKISEIEIQQK